MRQIIDSVWQRRGTSWIWDAEALAQVGVASEVLSLRQFLISVVSKTEDRPIQTTEIRQNGSKHTSPN